MSGKPILHHLQNSQAQKILFLMEELHQAHGFEYEVKNYDRVKGRAHPDLFNVYMTGRSPLLTTAEGDVFGESHAIATYLLRRYDADGRFGGKLEPGSAGDGGKQAVEGDKWDAWFHEEKLSSFSMASLEGDVGLLFIMDIIPGMSPWIARPVSKGFCSAIKGAMMPRVQADLKVLEDALKDNEAKGRGDWFSGLEEPGKCDFMLSFPLDILIDRKIVDLEKENCPRIGKWRERIRKRPAWERSLARGNGYNWRAM